MGCRNREFSGGQESAASASLSEALLFTTMCIIGLPVDVHVKDGSIYSGIFHTACVENDYGIVLKKARMIKNGNRDANVAGGDLIETLVVISEDLVQVVAKGIRLPTDGFACNDTSANVGDIAGTIPSFECADRGVKMKKSNKINMDRKQTIQTRTSPQIENGNAHGFTHTTVCHVGNAVKVENGNPSGTHSVKNEEPSGALVNERQVGDDRLQGKQVDYDGKSNFITEETKCEVQGSGSSLDASCTQSKAVEEIHRDMVSKMLPNEVPAGRLASSDAKQNNQCQERGTSDNSICSNVKSFGISTSSAAMVEGTKESWVSSSSTPTEMVPPKSLSFPSKESKLNPGAKVFCPTFATHRSLTPPAVPTVTNLAYIPDNFPVVPVASAQPEVEISPFVPRSSLPVKFVPYGNLIAGNGASDCQYSQQIIGHVGSRTHPARYVSQNQSIQTGVAYMHSNSQNVMVGRVGQLVYMHPVSHDVNQGVAAFSQVSTRPLLTAHQGHLPKHQGSAANQALQLCVTPPFIAGGQQPFAVQTHIPLPQPPYPVIRPLPLPGSNGIFNPKFP